MKIKNDEETFIIPVSSGIHILYENIYKDRLISDLSSYFIQKKKTKCIVFDEEDDPIPSKNVNFIYLPMKEELGPVFSFKAKTMLNTELTQLINNNPQMYNSIDHLRTDFKELLTDSGMFRFLNILTSGTNLQLDLQTEDFDIPRLLQTLGIDTSKMTHQQMMIILYNLQLFVNRDKMNICYLDFEIDDDTISWMRNIHSSNVLFLVSNEMIDAKNYCSFDSMILLSPYDYLETVDADKDQIAMLSYIFHPVVLKHPEYQSEKIRSLMTRFTDTETTFLINFTTAEDLKTL